MFAPINEVLSEDPGVTELLGTGVELRLYVNEADEGTSLPYAVMHQLGGPVENQLSGPGMTHRYLVQIGCYSGRLTEARAVAKAIRKAIEPHADVVFVGGETRDPKTRHFGYRFDIEWLISQ